MDLEAAGNYCNIVIKADPFKSFTIHDTVRSCIEIHINKPKITENDALKAIAKAMNVKVNNILLL
jgi:hypothetical protein